MYRYIIIIIIIIIITIISKIYKYTLVCRMYSEVNALRPTLSADPCGRGIEPCVLT